MNNCKQEELDIPTEAKICNILKPNHQFWPVARLKNEATHLLFQCSLYYAPGPTLSRTHVAEVHPVPLFPGQNDCSPGILLCVKGGEMDGANEPSSQGVSSRVPVDHCWCQWARHQ